MTVVLQIICRSSAAHSTTEAYTMQIRNASALKYLNREVGTDDLQMICRVPCVVDGWGRM